MKGTNRSVGVLMLIHHGSTGPLPTSAVSPPASEFCGAPSRPVRPAPAPLPTAAGEKFGVKEWTLKMESPESIFKVHFFTPNFSPAGAVGCYDTSICMCHEEFVTYHSPPLVFELSEDPSEGRPLSPDTEPRLAEVLERVEGAVTEHRRTLTPVERQLTWAKVLWKPWLQPCCGTFPFCSCEESNHTSAGAE
uniref:Uncharacterized protein n=1 Tax=Sinocyclocheilus rhinocerous TaxID=307959 RepID=A0A673NFD2_9TELE